MNKRHASARRALLALIAAAIVPALACGLPSESQGPNVVIISPTDGSTVIIGQQVLVQSSASDEKGIARVELLVNSVAVRADPPVDGTPTTFAIAQPWTPEATGDFVIHVVAYNTKDQASHPTSITLHVVEDSAQITPTPGSTQTPVPDVTEEGGCTLNASYVADLTVPDNTVIQPGVAFTKSWRIRNSGTCDWEPGFQLVFVEGSQLGLSVSVAVPATLSGATVDVAAQMVAPAEPGTYQGRWRMQSDQGQAFGSTIYVLIVVPEPVTPTSTSEPTPTATPTSTVVTATAQPDYPDLDVADVIPAFISGEVGDWFEIQVAVRNNSTALSPPTKLEGTFPPGGGTETVVIPVLDPGEVHIATLQYHITTPVYGDGTIKVDAEDVVHETDEDNNEVTLPVIVDPPDLMVSELTLNEGDFVNLDGIGASDFGWSNDGGSYYLRPQAGATAYIMASVTGSAHYAQIDPAQFDGGDIPAGDLAVGTIIAVRTDTSHRGFIRVEALDLGGGTAHIFWDIWDWPPSD
ncbi:MAG: NBR1-Ig-like domain-containing protein [Chloroflexota bacterium]|nr:NBR1-Ig-like domain-containing protein [Chloroflexota bacterium]